MKNDFTVLVAEDEESDFRLLERALRKSHPGIRISWVRDGVEAIDYLKGEAMFADRQQFPVPQLVVLDLKMPGTTGMEVLQWIRKSPRYRLIPTLVMSSSEQPTDIQQAYTLGANTFFVKPTNFETLLSLCEHLGGYWTHSVKPKLEP